MSGVRPVNWEVLIHEYVEKSIPHIRWKPSFLSPYILHLYHHYDCFIVEEEDLLNIVADEVVYKLGPKVEVGETGMKDSNDPAILKEPPVSPILSFLKLASPPPPPHCLKVGPNWEAYYKDVNFSAWDFPEAPFKRIHDELAELQTQYYRMEHITKGENRALDNYRPGNILRELAKKAHRKNIEQLETEKAQMVAQVAAMPKT